MTLPPIPRTLCLLLALAAPAAAQTSPPPGVLQPPPKTRPAAAPAAAPPRAAPVTGVQQVAPFTSPMPAPSVLGHSAPGRTATGPSATGPGTRGRSHPPVVQPSHELHPTKVEARKPDAGKVNPPPAAAPTAAPPPPPPTSTSTSSSSPGPGPGPSTGQTPPAAATDEKKPAGSGLPLPRFASLRSDEVFLRVGPGTRYPVDWVYHRRDLPVEIQREFEVWRLIQDQDGTKGWVHQATLTGRRSFVVTGAERTLRKSPSDDATPVALLKPGVIGRIRACEAGKTWCDMQVGDYRGWLRRDEVWGTYPGEAVN